MTLATRLVFPGPIGGGGGGAEAIFGPEKLPSPISGFRVADEQATSFYLFRKCHKFQLYVKLNYYVIFGKIIYIQRRHFVFRFFTLNIRVG